MQPLETLWQKYVNTVSETFSYSKEKLAATGEARLVATLPSIAGCEDAEKSGFINLCLYVIERIHGKSYFLHNKADDEEPLHRLEPFRRNMVGGDRSVVEAGMARLGLVMLNDYKADMESDNKKGKYNPLVNKVWDYVSMKRKLVADASLSNNPTLDSVLSLDDSIQTWWDM